MCLGLSDRGRGRAAHRAGCPRHGHHHPGAGSLLQHARPDEVPQKGFQRGHLCGRHCRPCGTQPSGSQLQVCPGGKTAVRYARRWYPAGRSLFGAGAGVYPGSCGGGQHRAGLPGLWSHHPAQELPRQPEYAVFLHQRPLRPQPHHDGGHGDGVQRHYDAGQVPGRNFAS